MNKPTSHAAFRLVPIGLGGRPQEPLDPLPAEIAEACRATAEHYRAAGFTPPWIGYLSVDDGVVVGGGAFVTPPAENRVEIAYFTAEPWRRKGYARRTAEALIAIARRHAPGVELFAKTEPQANASTAVLSGLGFTHLGVTTDHEIGEAWAWRLKP